ncbi:hypothetical protein SporoP8_12740 [Sporosarcina ureae]|nr:hypothetical protein SporoP8_12740 [Sporosarcina ureae]
MKGALWPVFLAGGLFVCFVSGGGVGIERIWCVIERLWTAIELLGVSIERILRAIERISYVIERIPGIDKAFTPRNRVVTSHDLGFKVLRMTFIIV